MRTQRLLCAALVGLACSSALLADIPGSKLSDAQRGAALAESVQKWISDQSEASKNEYGKPTKRGYFSRFFKPLDADSYAATVHVETAGAETKTTERYLLTLKKSAKGFDIAGSELKDTYAGMHRVTGGKCLPFEKFTFDRGGMNLNGKTHGTVCVSYYQGRVEAFVVHADEMSYRFEPPEYARALHLNQDFHSIFPSVRKNHERELEFVPAAFLFDCDAESCDVLLAEHFTGLDLQAAAQPVTGTMQGGPSWAKPLIDDLERERRENAFAHFRTPNPPGNRGWSVFVAREVSPFTYPGFEDGLFDIQGSLPGSGVDMVYDNWGGWEFEFRVWPRQTDFGGPFGESDQLFATLYGFYSEDTLKNTEPYELERREEKSARWHQVYSIKGTVDMGITDPEMLEADIEFGIELKQAVRELPFFIQSIPRREFTGKNKARVLHVNSVQLDGKELTWTRTSQLGGIVILPQEMPAGTKLNLRMNFATRAMYKLNTSFTYVSRFGWMPFVRFGDFIDEFELTLRTPAKFKMLGIGQKTTEKTEGDINVTHWKSESAVVFPSVTYGEYEEDGPGDKFEPAKKADGTPIPVMVHVDKSSFGDFGITPGALRPIAQQAVNSINLYREISGIDYPYGELNLVCDPLIPLYGQAPSSLIYLGFGVFRGEGFLAQFFENPTSIAKFLKSVTAHEVGHQWWGSRVSNANDRNYWFVESLAEFFSGLYLEAVFGQKEYQEQVEEWRRVILNRNLKASVQNASSIWSGEGGDGSTYQAAVYNKGPYAFHMLREIFKGEGPPGPEGADKKFFAFLKKFSMELAEKREIVSLDIQYAAEKALGGVDPEGNPYNVDLAWFFDQWIRGAGVPQYRMTYDVRQTEDGGWLIEGVVQQRVLVGSSRNHEVLKGEYYRGVVDVTVKAKGENYKKRLIVEGAETPFKLKVPAKPVEIELNEHGEVLAHDVLLNKSWD